MTKKIKATIDVELAMGRKPKYTQEQWDERERFHRSEVFDLDVRLRRAVKMGKLNGERESITLPDTDWWPGPPWPGHPQRRPEALIKAVGYGLGRLVSFLKGSNADYGGPRVSWGGHSHLFGLGSGYRESSFALPKGAHKAINHMCDVVDSFGKASYRAGLEDGTNLLSSLAAGTLTKPEFDQRVAKELRDHQ